MSELGKDPRSAELFEREEVPGTPFFIINKDGESFGVFNKYRITKPGPHDEVLKSMTDLTWNNIVRVIGLCIQILKDNELLNNQ